MGLARGCRSQGTTFGDVPKHPGHNGSPSSRPQAGLGQLHAAPQRGLWAVLVTVGHWGALEGPA